MRRVIPLVVVLFLLASAWPVPARAEPAIAPQAALAGDPIKFDKITLEEGLSQSSIHAILQDRYGFMWFGSEDGLNKYDGYRFTIYKNDPTDAASLGDNNILALYEDRAGILWIGTDGGGLDRYDRLADKFTHYRHNPNDPYSLSSNVVRAILEDSGGTLWVGTSGGGLNRFEPASGQFMWYRHDTRNAASLVSDTVNAVIEDPSGGLWVGTPEGLDYFDRQVGAFRHYIFYPEDPQGLASYQVNTLYRDRSGTLWVGTNGGGLVQFVAENQETHIFQYLPGDSSSISSNTIWGILQDRSGNVWVATQEGLNQFDLERRRFNRYKYDPLDSFSLSDNVLWSIYQDQTGVIWLGTASQGLNKINPSRQLFAHYKHDAADPNSLVENNVYAILEDRQGSLWIGTAGGLEKMNHEIKQPADTAGTSGVINQPGQFTHYLHDPLVDDSLGGPNISQLYEDRSGSLWVGIYSGGLDLFDRRLGTFSHYRSLPSNSESLSNDNVRALQEDYQGMMWVGTWGGGLNKLDPRLGVFEHYRHQSADPNSLSSDMVYTIYEDAANNLWVGTDSGLDRLDRSTGGFVHYRSDPNRTDSLGSSRITCLFEDRAGVLWVGTAGGGLNRFDRQSGNFTPASTAGVAPASTAGVAPASTAGVAPASTAGVTRFSEKEGLPGASVYGILQDENGLLWLSTNNGIARFDPLTRQVKSYGTQHGLQSREFNAGACFKNKNGEMFFGGPGGLNVFFPQQIKENTSPPPVALTAFTQGGEDVLASHPAETVQKITLNWPHNYFEFEFSALSFGQPENNQYAYLLEGFDRDWNRIGARRFGRYTNLPGRTYTLRLRAANDDGVWNEQGKSIVIEVVPPVWETWWFLGSAGLLGLLAAFAIYETRVRDVRRRALELETLVSKRTHELRQEIDQRLKVEAALRESEMEKAIVAERSRLARDLHDAVTQTLFSASLIAEALPETLEKDPAEGRRLAEELRQANCGALAEMRTLLLELRPAALMESNLGDLLRLLAEAASGREGIPIQVEVSLPCPLPPEVHLALYRITQEALNNIVRHSRARHASIRLECAGEALTPATNAGVTPAANAGVTPAVLAGVSLTIEDDGCGFSIQQVPQDHLGLSIMRERAQAIHASLQIESQPGCGTRVILNWHA